MKVLEIRHASTLRQLADLLARSTGKNPDQMFEILEQAYIIGWNARTQDIVTTLHLEVRETHS